jgi:CHAT domain-containing protein
MKADCSAPATPPLSAEQVEVCRAKTEAGKARILHFATHGFFDPSHGMYSGVVLAQPSSLPAARVR